MRTNDGQVVAFDVGTLDLSGGGLPAPHLREHLVSGVPITVYYSAENGANRGQPIHRRHRHEVLRSPSPWS